MMLELADHVKPFLYRNFKHGSLQGGQSRQWLLSIDKNRIPMIKHSNILTNNLTGDLVSVIRREHSWTSMGNISFFSSKYFNKLRNSSACRYITIVSSHCRNVILKVST